MRAHSGYILREMCLLFSLAIDEDIKTQINMLEKTFRVRVTNAFNKELNLLRLHLSSIAYGNAREILLGKARRSLDACRMENVLRFL